MVFTDESCLIEGLVSGNTQNFETLVDLYHKRIYDFIFRMVHNRTNAEDITQEVFIKVYKNIHRLDLICSFKTWIYRIAYTTAVSYLRRNKNIAADIEAEEIASNRDYIGDFETRQAVLKGIQDLKPECRAIFFLRIIEDLTFDQIGAALGMPAGSAKQKFYNNRKKLIDNLTDSFKEV